MCAPFPPSSSLCAPHSFALSPSPSWGGRALPTPERAPTCCCAPLALRAPQILASPSGGSRQTCKRHSRPPQCPTAHTRVRRGHHHRARAGGSYVGGARRASQPPALRAPLKAPPTPHPPPPPSRYLQRVRRVRRRVWRQCRRRGAAHPRVSGALHAQLCKDAAPAVQVRGACRVGDAKNSVRGSCPACPPPAYQPRSALLLSRPPPPASQV